MTKEAQKEEQPIHLSQSPDEATVSATRNDVSEETLVSESSSLANTSAAGLHPGSLIGQKYKIICATGSGGMSSVYKVEQIILGKTMAVKVLKVPQTNEPKLLQRFQNEGKAVSRLEHKNIIRFYEFGVDPSVGPYIAMDFCEGVSLNQAMSAHAGNADWIASVVSQICDALKHAHTQGVVHRDLKPSNIMVTGDSGSEPAIKIIDFGVAKINLDGTQAAQLTQTGDVFGTPLYMSPEQCLGKRVDHRSDIYSLGCIIYEFLTGSPPFVAESSIEVISKRLVERPKSPASLVRDRKVSAPLCNIAMKCLEPDPRERYQDVSDLMKDIQKARAGSRVERRGGRRYWLKLTAAFVALSVPAMSMAVWWTINSNPIGAQQMALAANLPPQIEGLLLSADNLRAVQATRFAYEFVRAGDYKSAEQSVKNVIQAHPELRTTLLPLTALIKGVLGKPDEVEQICLELANDDKEKAAEHLNSLGYQLNARFENYEAARPLFERARALYEKYSPQSKQIYKERFNIATCLHHEGLKDGMVSDRSKIEQAIAEYKALIPLLKNGGDSRILNACTMNLAQAEKALSR